MQSGTVFDIKGFALNDGPGIRTTVFMKGCPLRCVWCHNPEGLSPSPELYVKHTKCMHCKKCERPCTHEDCHALGGGRCLHVCPNDCISVCGTRLSSAELAERLLRDRDVYELSGGGVTFSGGEPLMQAEFVRETADLLRGEGIGVALETSSFAPSEVYRRVVGSVELVLADIKLFDRDEHIRYTGVSNEQILCNLRWLMEESGKRFVLRVPLIPDITDTERNLSAIGEFVGSHHVELLPYNSLAGAKYASVGRDFALSTGEYRPSERVLDFFADARIK